MPFNLNEYVWVQLRSRGRLELRRQHDELRRAFSKLEPYSDPVEDADGWSKWQLWTLMQYLGPLCSIGFDPPFATEIQFERPQHVETSCVECGGRGRINIIRIGNEVNILCPACSGQKTSGDVP